MNEVSFLNNIMECKKILEDWNLLLKASSNNLRNSSQSKYSDEFVKLSRNDEYFKMYKCAIENDDYDFLLIDKSFFQFSYDWSYEKKCEEIRMAFYPSADECSYESFLMEEFGLRRDECGSEYYELYQQYVSEQTPVIRTAFRYDYDVSLYKNQIHSAAHVHFGNEENIRIPINSQLKPSGFVKMVLEYFYYNKWKDMIINKETDIWIASHDTEVLDRTMFDEADRIVPHIFILNKKA